MEPQRYPFESAVRELAAMLTRRDYAGIDSLTGGTRLTAADLLAAVSEYPATLVEPPALDAAPLDVIEIAHGAVRRWSVNVPLWSVEEGRSDLTLELTVVESPSGNFEIQVDGLHVL